MWCTYAKSKPSKAKRIHTKREHVMHSLSIINIKNASCGKGKTREKERTFNVSSNIHNINRPSTDKNYYCYLFHISYAASLAFRSTCVHSRNIVVVVSFVLPFIHSSLQAMAECAVLCLLQESTETQCELGSFIVKLY